ncbi:copper amine oxidase N-terminal domain-containing protein [Paenibacillus graminis]|uniref:copper amine oxidase N-terminal domain-containing protein n=1 Tax=Paenibacillus graminis TaxID=189425 RepID=UPI002DBE5179|nr:copper amine oxidase N-terminal domain-containing protein [Paenibacillus graminis]MEC0167359.1 copper amine oxidase N-terminal domain-containing protein [Paenibacillus graminis]
MKTIRIRMSYTLLALMMVFGLIGGVASAAQVKVSVKVNGKAVSFPDAQPYYESNRVMIPIRFVSEALGATVGYSSVDRRVTIEQDAKRIVMKINSDSVTVDSVLKTLDVPARLEQNRTYVPLRFVSEALGATVGWNQQQRLVTISTDKESNTPAPTPAPSTAPKSNGMYTVGFKFSPGYTKLAKQLFVNNMKVANGKLTFTLPEGAKATKYGAGDTPPVKLEAGKTYTFALGKGMGFVSFSLVYPGRDSQEGYSVALDSKGNQDIAELFGNITGEAIVINDGTASTLAEVQKMAMELE